MRMLSAGLSIAMVIVTVFAGANTARGNAITITNLSIASVEDGMADIQFDLSWSNGWNLTWSEDGGSTWVTNHDAAYVFLKYRIGPGEWHHAWLAATGHLATGDTRIDVASNGGDTNIGAFVYFATTTSGTVNCEGMRLRWAFTKNGLMGTNSVDISVHAIEMVYVPEGSFYVGSGGADRAGFYTYPDSANPYLITGENAISVGRTNGCLHYLNTWFGSSDEFGWGGYSFGGDEQGPIPEACPKGFKSFYVMKYEISQGQYAHFLNYVGGYAPTYYPNVYGQQRYTIRLTNGHYVADAPDRACNWLSWADLAAYLDWAGLRPMTELEFEKVCRGPLSPVPNEYAWGSVSITKLTNFFGVDGSGEETAAPPTANAVYDGNLGPVRVGLFASSNSTRQSAGAGYYGGMELSGNLYEIVVGIHHPDGRAFTGEHGDGELLVRPAGWPSPSSGGTGVRGGSYVSVAVTLYTSDRKGMLTGSSFAAARRSTVGGRGVRSAP